MAEAADATGRAPRSRAAGIAHLLDSRWRVPGTRIRFGLDALLGLVPVAGDTIGLLLGAVIVSEARLRRVPRRVVARMLLNLGIDWLLGLVPLVGDLVDIWYKGNMRNLALLERELARRERRRGGDSAPTGGRSGGEAG